MIVLLAHAAAQVQPDQIPAIDTQAFSPSVSATRMLWTEDAVRLPNRYVTAGLMVHYARDPFIWIDSRGQRTPIVSDVLAGSLTGGVQLGPAFLGAHVPLVLRSGGLFGGETGLGDLAVQTKVHVLDHDDLPVGLAFRGAMVLPTSTTDAPLGGGGFGYTLEAIVDRPIGDALVALNLGLRGQPDRKLGSIDWSDSLVARVGAGVPFSERVQGSLEWVGSYNVGGAAGGAGIPMEVLAGAGWRVIDDIEVRLGAGTGITGGIGAPVFRGLAGIRYAPELRKDTDGDGIVDRVDGCRTVAEDFDGVEDADGCPEPALVRVRVEDAGGEIVGSASWTLVGPEGATGKAGDSLERYPGSYVLRAEAPGHLPNEADVRIKDGKPQDLVVVLERVVLPGRISVTIQDETGVPLQGRWWIVGEPSQQYGGGDSIEVAPGPYKVRVEAVDFRPQVLEFVLAEKGEHAIAVRLKTAKVVLKGEQITIKESVYFETAQATIKPESFALLDEVAQTIQDHPELKKIRIEGHTDSRGDAFTNRTLSQARAAAVLEHLVSRGVDPSRLTAVGFGEEKPLLKGNNEAAWSRNRRVDFMVSERDNP